MPQWGEVERFRKWLKIGTLKPGGRKLRVGADVRRVQRMAWGCQYVDQGVFQVGYRLPERRRTNLAGRVCATPGPARLKAFLSGMSYEVGAEPSKSHLTTRMVTSSLKATPPQNSAALLKILVMRPSADREEPPRTTAERRSIPNSSPSWFSASVMPAVEKTSTSPAIRSAEARSQISSGNSPMGGHDESRHVRVPVFA